LHPDEQLVLGIFRLSEEKRPLLFADIAIELVRAHPNCRVLHIGEGSFRDAVEGRVSEAGLAKQIRLLGRRSDLPAAFGAANVLVHVAQYEGTPNVVLEAQHFGVPVVATKAGGTTDAVLDGVTGYLLDCDDRAGIVEKVSKLLSDPDKARELGEAGAKFVHERFGLDRMVSETLDMQRAAFDRVGLPDLTG
jgi:glycosyltransferase involved in cell wall biosynthesis